MADTRVNMTGEELIEFYAKIAYSQYAFDPEDFKRFLATFDPSIMKELQPYIDFAECRIRFGWYKNHYSEKINIMNLLLHCNLSILLERTAYTGILDQFLTVCGIGYFESLSYKEDILRLFGQPTCYHNIGEENIYDMALLIKQEVKPKKLRKGNRAAIKQTADIINNYIFSNTSATRYIGYDDVHHIMALVAPMSNEDLFQIEAQIKYKCFCLQYVKQLYLNKQNIEDFFKRVLKVPRNEVIERKVSFVTPERIHKLIRAVKDPFTDYVSILSEDFSKSMFSVHDFLSAIDDVSSDEEFEKAEIVIDVPDKVMQKPVNFSLPDAEKKPKVSKTGIKKFNKLKVLAKYPNYKTPVKFNDSLITARARSMFEIMCASKVPPGCGLYYENEDTKKLTLDEVLQLFPTFKSEMTRSSAKDAIGRPIDRKDKSQIRFIESQKFSDVVNMREAFDIALNMHYEANPHHPENEENIRFVCSYETMVDLLMSASRCGSSVNEGFYIMQDWIFTNENGFTIPKPKFKNLNPLAVLCFLSEVKKRGLWECNRKDIRVDRTLPLNNDEQEIDWVRLTRDVAERPRLLRNYLHLPKFKSYMKEAKAHIAAVNDELYRCRIASNHDKDKMYSYMIVPYVWQWFVPKVTPTADDPSQPGPSNPPPPDSDSDDSTDGYNSDANPFPRGSDRKIPDMMSRICDKILQKFGTISNTASSVLDRMLGVLSKMEGMIDSMIVGFNDIVNKVLGTCNSVPQLFCNIIQALVGYALWKSDSCVVVKGIGMYLMVDAAQLTTQISRMMAFYNEWRTDNDFVTGTDTSEEKDLDIKDVILQSIEKFDAKTAAPLISCILGCFVTYKVFKASGQRVSTVTDKVANSFKNIHFIGAGLFGIERIGKYIANILKACMEAAARALGRGDPSETIKALKRSVALANIKMDYWISSEGINAMRSMEHKHLEAIEDCANIVKLRYEIFTMPRSPEVDVLRQSLESNRKNILEMINTVYRISKATKFRNTPFHIQLYGDAGIGKSTLMHHLVNNIRESYYPTMSQGASMYCPNEEDKFWPGYTGQPIIVVDEMYPILEAEILVKWLTIISNVPVMVPMAELSEKVQFFESEWIISGTNVLYPKASGVSCPEAVWRRRHLLVEVECDPDVIDKSTSKFSLELFKKKYPGKKATDFEHLKFNLLKPVPPEGNVSLGNTKYMANEVLPTGVKIPTTNMTLTQLEDQIRRRRAAIVTEESTLPRSKIYEDMAYIDSVVDEIREDVIKQNKKNAPWFETYIPNIHLAIECAYSTPQEATLLVVDQQEHIAIYSEEDVEERVKTPQRFILNIGEDPVKAYMLTVDVEGCGYELSENGVILDNEKHTHIIQEFVKTFKIQLEILDPVEPTCLDDEDIRRRKERLAALKAQPQTEATRRLIQSIEKSLNPQQRSSMTPIERLVEDRVFGYEFISESLNFDERFREYSIFSVSLAPTIHDETRTEEIATSPGSAEIIGSFIFLTQKELNTNTWRNYNGTEGNRRNTGINPTMLDHIRYDDVKGWVFKYTQELENYVKIKTRNHSLESPINMTLLESFTSTVESFMAMTADQRAYLKLTANNKFRKNLTYWKSRQEFIRLANARAQRILETAFETQLRKVKKYLNYVKRAIYVIGVSIGLVYLFKGIASMFSSTKEAEPTSKIFFKSPKALPKIVSTATSPETKENRINALKRNVVLVRYKGAVSNALGIHGNCMLINKHLIWDVYDNKTDSFEIDIKRGFGPNSEWHTVLITAEQCYTFPGKDMVLINNPAISSFKSILKHFRSNRNNEDLKDLEIFYRSEGMENRVVLNKSIPVYNFSRVCAKTNAIISLTEMLSVKHVLPKGSSGGVVINDTNELKFIVGIQCYTDNMYSYIGIITLNDLQKAMDTIGFGITNDGPHSLNDAITPTSKVIDTNIAVVGSVDKEFVVGSHVKSNFIKTPIYKHVPKSQRIPAILSIENLPEATHPLKNSINKYGRDNMKPLNQELLDYVTLGVADYYKKRIGRRSYPLLSLEETIRGLPDNCLDPLNAKTSPGIPYVYKRKSPGKKDLFRYDDYGEISYLSERLREDFEVLEENFRRGNIPPLSAYEFPKDELRPIQKVLALKTRSIRVLPVTLNMLYRKYNGVIDSEIQALADGTNPICIGINPDSLSWDRLYWSLKCKSDYGQDFDVTNWDGHFTHQLKQAVNKFNDALANEGLDKEEQRIRSLVREALSQSITHGYVQFYDCVFQPHRGLGSGYAGTTPENCKAHFILLAYLITEIVYEKTNVIMPLKDILKYVSFYVYGDDLILAISPIFLPYCSYVDIADKYDYYGWPVTSAAKDGSMESRPIEELQFLKRKFAPYQTKYGVKYCGALEENVIYDLLYWMRKNVNEDRQFMDNLNDALEFSWAHGKEFYERILKLINDSLEKENFPGIYAPWIQMNSKMVNRLLSA